jgi:lipid-A-disaccharide synthase
VSEPLRVLLVAGETSGDLHGAALVRALRRRAPEVDVRGIGGAHLRAAGMHVLVDTAAVATMGFVETLGAIRQVWCAYRMLVRFLDTDRPRLVVLIDYPDFNLRLARQAKRRGIPVFYFISPQVWAWRRGRIRTIAERVDKLAAVFPFEPALYNQDGRHVAEFVGHPLLDVVRQTRSREETRARWGLAADRPLLALLPGSRRKELAYLLPPLCAAARLLAAEGWQAVIALAPNLRRDDLVAVLGAELPCPVAEDDTYNTVAAADAAVVTSGTATLETALLGCPMAIVYRMAPMTYWLARRLVRVEWIGMPNIILQRGMFPELIQDAVSAPAIAAAVRGLVDRRAEVTAALATLRARLGEPGAADRAAALALGLVQ